jgi:hypothetical protein
MGAPARVPWPNRTRPLVADLSTELYRALRLAVRRQRGPNISHAIEKHILFVCVAVTVAVKSDHIAEPATSLVVEAQVNGMSAVTRPVQPP